MQASTTRPRFAISYLLPCTSKIYATAKWVPMEKKQVVVVGAGFAGLAVAKRLAGDAQIELTVIDKRNHHLFQPLLYQVAMAALSPADIAVPIRALLSDRAQTRVVRETVQRVDLESQVVHTDAETLPYDYLVLACGSQHSYFGNEQWEIHAPGLKNVAPSNRNSPTRTYCVRNSRNHSR